MSSLHKVEYFYDVGSTYAIDQQINHLHNDIANMWRNNVLPYAIEDNIERKKNELNVDLNGNLNTINKGNGNKVSSVRIIVFSCRSRIK